MRLEVESFNVQKMVFDEDEGLTGDVLHLNRQKLESILLSDHRLKEVSVEIANPGERKRIIHIMDVIEPRCKIEGGTIFPGFLGPPRTVGSGKTQRLSGAAVITTAEIVVGHHHRGDGSVHGPRERLADMFGLGSDYTPVSRTCNLVISCKSAAGQSPIESDAAIRMAGLRLSEYVAAMPKTSGRSEVDLYELRPCSEDLPKVGYIFQINSTGFTRDTFFYGRDLQGVWPTLIHPNETMDGALVNGSTSQQALTTHVYCNNPVIRRLYREHGKKLNFAGVILKKGEQTSNTDKERAAFQSVKLAKMLGMEGVVITQAQAGNTIMDQMLVCQSCEQLGIKTVVITYEMCGADGKDKPLIFCVPEASSIVSTGDREQRVSLERADHVIGGERLLYSEDNAQGPLKVYVMDICSSVDQTGFWHLRGLQY